MNNNSKKYKYLFNNIIAFLCGNLGTKLISFLWFHFIRIY